jgi:membrane associated rhomboid family serine protease
MIMIAEDLFTTPQNVIHTKPTNSEYGYLLNGVPIGCSKEELIEKGREIGLPAIELVWTPEHQTLVSPGEVSFLLDLYRSQTRKDNLKGVLWGLLPIILIGFFIILSGSPWWLVFQNLWFVLGIAVIGFSLWSAYRSKFLTGKDLLEQAQAIKFGQWLETQHNPMVYTKGLACMLITVGCVQAIVGEKESIEAAGLVKPSVWNGEVWRLFTCVTLHGSFVHIWMNIQALWTEGKLIETIAHRGHLSIVFLVGALSGSICSLILYPNDTSVGASGGIMGLIGYQLMLGHRKKKHLPAGFYKAVGVGILFIGILGAVGFSLIDNAAHAGGLLAGVICGHYLIGKAEHNLSIIPGKLVKLLSCISIIIIGSAGILSIVMMVKGAID